MTIFQKYGRPGLLLLICLGGIFAVGNRSATITASDQSQAPTTQDLQQSLAILTAKVEALSQQTQPPPKTKPDPQWGEILRQLKANSAKSTGIAGQIKKLTARVKTLSTHKAVDHTAHLQSIGQELKTLATQVDTLEIPQPIDHTTQLQQLEGKIAEQIKKLAAKVKTLPTDRAVDHTARLQSIGQELKALATQVAALKIPQPIDHTAQLQQLEGKIDKISTRQPVDYSQDLQEILEKLAALSKLQERLMAVEGKLDSLIELLTIEIDDGLIPSKDLWVKQFIYVSKDGKTGRFRLSIHKRKRENKEQGDK